MTGDRRLAKGYKFETILDEIALWAISEYVGDAGCHAPPPQSLYISTICKVRQIAECSVCGVDSMLGKEMTSTGRAWEDKCTKCF